MAANRKPNIVYLDNKAFCIRVPTSEEWDKLPAYVKAHDLHWEYIWSWLQDPIPDNSSSQPTHRMLRGCTALCAPCAAHSDSKGPYIGFRPIFVPIDPETLQPDMTQWTDTEDGTVLTLGTLYMNNAPLAVPQDPTDRGDIPNYIPGATLHIGHYEPDPAYQIQAIKCGWLFVADRNLLKDISWNELDRCGMIYGDKSKLKPSKQSHPSHKKAPTKQKTLSLKKRTSKNSP